MKHSQILNFALFVSCCILTSSAVFSAGATTDGRDEAGAICKKLSLSSYQKQCLDVVREAEFISVPAAQMCGQMSLSSYSIDCMKVIANKVFLDAELDHCKEKSLSSSQTDCLKSSGKKATAGSQIQTASQQTLGGSSDSSSFSAQISDHALLKQLKKIESKLRDHDTGQAQLELGQVIRSLEKKLFPNRD